MELMRFVVPTPVATPGMTVRELFDACAKADVPGIPFRNAEGRIVGKASIRHVLKETCIPRFMVDNVRVLGDELAGLSIPPIRAREVLDMTMDQFILPKMAVITPRSPISKALAVMEHRDTTYLFVIDAERRYHGTISIMKIARRILERYP
ncbi:MAG: CBS domain-containing protein [Gammaproteobacteria bacterium]|nr:CBS domain-containing protein [Gammaproteobacteria bacterium]